MSSVFLSHKKIEMQQQLPWTELYRPTTLTQLVCNNSLYNHLQLIYKNGHEIPALLLCGSPGLGKTTSALVLAHEWYPLKADFDKMVLEVNASKDCSILNVRKTILPFMECHLVPQKPRLSTFTKKILILDEIERMTPEAQSALRCPLEKFSNSTLVIMIGNNASDIISANISRCVRIMFTPIDFTLLRKHLQNILLQQNVAMSTQLADNDCFWTWFLSQCSDGDIRYAVQLLQTVFSCNVDIDNIADTCISSYPSLKQIEKSVQELIRYSPTPNQIYIWAKKVYSQGFIAQNWCQQLLNYVQVYFTQKNSIAKDANYMSSFCKCVSKITETEMKICQGSDVTSSISECMLVIIDNFYSL